MDNRHNFPRWPAIASPLHAAADSTNITDKTGAAGVKHYIEARYQIKIPKHDPRVVMIRDKIDAEYKADRVSAISDEEMTAWIKEAFGADLLPLR